MRPSVLDELRRLQEDLGEPHAGQHLQSLLALAFVKAGLTVGEIRRVEGPDLDVDGAGERWQVEVKTTVRGSFTLGDKDLADAAEAGRRGRRPVLALLRLTALEGWRIVGAQGLRRKTLHLRDLALRRVAPLEEAALAHFDDVATVWIPLIRRDPDGSFEAMENCAKGGRWRPEGVARGEIPG